MSVKGFPRQINNGKTRAVVKICGDEYIIRGDAEEEYIRHLAAIVDERMREVQASHPNQPRHKLALMVAINLADELERMRDENKELMELIGEVK